MDSFLGNIHTLLFKKWILAQNLEGMQFIENNLNEILIKTETCEGLVRFNDLDIIELIVTNTLNDSIDFYIHFQMNNLH